MEGLRTSDRFTAVSKTVISSQDYQTLTLFYQPIIGQGAFVLYCTLIGLIDRQNLASKEYFHSDLESLLNEKISNIEVNRFKLEAIGLMDTYYLNDHFIYEIKMPLSASAFVNDGVLGEYLISSITKDRFKKVMDVFKTKSVNKKQYFKLSKSFDEVFESISTGESSYEKHLLGQKNGQGVNVSLHPFHWRTFEESIPKDFYQPHLLTEAVKEKIINLAYVYGLSELDARDVYLRSYDDLHQTISINRLAIEAREYYKLSTITSQQTVKEPLKQIEDLPTDATTYFKVVPPHQLLRELGDGMVSSSDLRIAERLIEDIGLDKGVTNVLLAYTFQIKNGILPSYEYFEKVGQGWKRNQITTVELAMDYVTHLRSQFEKRSSTTKGKAYKSNKPDVEIDWLDEYYKSI